MTYAAGRGTLARRLGLPVGTRVRWDRRARLSRDGALVTGGSPWGLVRLAPAARPFARRLRDAAELGVIPEGSVELATANRLVERGLAHPLPAARTATDVIVVVPAHDRPESLRACLESLAGQEVVVVDDASVGEQAVRAVVAGLGGRLVRHEVNRGPAAARNTGLAATASPLVAFLDSDASAAPGWLDRLVGHFDDPRVGIVAPRVRPIARDQSVLARYEQTRSELDMGSDPALVRPGSRLGYLPSAALVVRRAALPEGGFDESMRVGEDVDLVWRVVDAGWQVRYDPTVSVWHETRERPLDWAVRRYAYGTSAAALDRRHPGRLAPARLSGWNLLSLAALATGHPAPGLLVLTGGAAALTRRLHTSAVPVGLAPRLLGSGLAADVSGIGHLLRREWWPLGWLALAAARRSGMARAATAAMLAPIALEIVRRPPRLNAPTYVALRLLEDAAYGSGVIAAAVRGRRAGALLPQVRWPFLSRQVARAGARAHPVDNAVASH